MNMSEYEPCDSVYRSGISNDLTDYNKTSEAQFIQTAVEADMKYSNNEKDLLKTCIKQGNTKK